MGPRTGSPKRSMRAEGYRPSTFGQVEPTCGTGRGAAGAGTTATMTAVTRLRVGGGTNFSGAAKTIRFVTRTTSEPSKLGPGGAHGTPIGGVVTPPIALEERSEHDSSYR